MSEEYKTRITLIERLRNQNDQLAWEEFVSTYENYIFSILRSMNMNPSDSADLHQEILLLIWKSIHQYNRVENQRFRSWIATITRNRVLYFIRKRKKEVEKLERVKLQEEVDYLNSISLPAIGDIAEREWKNHISNLAVKRVEKMYTGSAMKVFYLTVEGKNANDIAEELGIKVESVYRLKARVKESLKKEILRLQEDLD